VFFFRSLGESNYPVDLELAHGFGLVISALRHLVAGIDSYNSCPRGSICGGFITAPPKPSVQTTLLLEAMASSEQREDAKWDHLNESIDLLFAKVGAIDRTQQQMSAQLDLSAQVMERIIQDQKTGQTNGCYR